VSQIEFAPLTKVRALELLTHSILFFKYFGCLNFLRLKNFGRIYFQTLFLSVIKIVLIFFFE